MNDWAAKESRMLLNVPYLDRLDLRRGDRDLFLLLPGEGFLRGSGEGVLGRETGFYIGNSWGANT